MFMDNRLAVISIIVNDSEASSEINKLLHDFSSYIVGRMGMPYKKRDVSIICIVMDAPEDVISSLSGKLGMLKRVSIKTTFSKK
jgi:putative iron-only hydrogenase system regulator